jgi:lysosomal acid lipase/cholesteryl ester hydrolase
MVEAKNNSSLSDNELRGFLAIYLLVLTVLISSPLLVLLEPTSYLQDPDYNKSTLEIIISRGFAAEEHFVQTKDGYILGMHRIVNPLLPRNSKPILLWHGIGTCSRDFVINDGKGSINETTEMVGNNLAFELAKKGFDVWMGNTRGNVYSRNHTFLDPEKDREFWNFTIDDLVKFDLPNTIDYILEKTGESSIRYIGHSQGAQIMFALLASQLQYNDIINLFVAMAPVTNFNRVASHIDAVLRSDLVYGVVARYIGPVTPMNPTVKSLYLLLCSYYLKYVCIGVNFLVVGMDFQQLNVTRYPIYITHYPSGAGSQNCLHQSQIGRSGRFQKFDYGTEGNLQKYGLEMPPEYDIGKITNAHIALFSALNDPIATQENIDSIRFGLNVKLLDDYVVPFAQWTHLDFTFGLDAGKYVNSRILSLL